MRGRIRIARASAVTNQCYLLDINNAGALAFVVAHEMGHVRLSHARDRFMADLVRFVDAREVDVAAGAEVSVEVD